METSLHDSETSMPLWNLDKIKSYMAYIKSNYKPSMSKEAKVVLAQFYEFQRNTDTFTLLRTTVRYLDSLIRLSQAHAKLCCRHEVIVMDVVFTEF